MCATRPAQSRQEDVSARLAAIFAKLLVRECADIDFEASHGKTNRVFKVSPADLRRRGDDAFATWRNIGFWPIGY